MELSVIKTLKLILTFTNWTDKIGSHQTNKQFTCCCLNIPFWVKPWIEAVKDIQNSCDQKWETFDHHRWPCRVTSWILPSALADICVTSASLTISTLSPKRSLIWALRSPRPYLPVQPFHLSASACCTSAFWCSIGSRACAFGRICVRFWKRWKRSRVYSTLATFNAIRLFGANGCFEAGNFSLVRIFRTLSTSPLRRANRIRDCVLVIKLRMRLNGWSFKLLLSKTTSLEPIQRRCSNVNFFASFTLSFQGQVITLFIAFKSAFRHTNTKRSFFRRTVLAYNSLLLSPVLTNISPTDRTVISTLINKLIFT